MATTRRRGESKSQYRQRSETVRGSQSQASQSYNRGSIAGLAAATNRERSATKSETARRALSSVPTPTPTPEKKKD